MIADALILSEASCKSSPAFPHQLTATMSNREKMLQQVRDNLKQDRELNPPETLCHVVRDSFQSLLKFLWNLWKKERRRKGVKRQRQEQSRSEARGITDELAVFTIL
ncbi:uncharacterized protein FMAN_15488 [Fusarium mangiferae]|uniref:Uncharacterized protein n=1 Tax=Fusarium mangiferae TaxID=192010 RepID=A0A1L7UF78_FUSMA|nr:uncharacterized protein FMAN_15488 [Fusarium mangiferae]CVL09324.1 uncharacterized protein FMAN_15488 [Fusarium mangiferae]